MPARLFNVLFLCSGNSARSIMAESLLTHWGRGKMRAFSAGSAPRGIVDPLALDVLGSLNLPIDGLGSKGWDRFLGPEAAAMDFVFTVCEVTAAMPAPAWPGNPVTAYWGVPDPVAATGSQVDRLMAYREAFRMLETRVKLFSSLPVEKLDRLTLQTETARIGTIGRDPSGAAA